MTGMVIEIANGTDDSAQTENVILVDGNHHIRGVYRDLNKRALDPTSYRL